MLAPSGCRRSLAYGGSERLSGSAAVAPIEPVGAKRGRPHAATRHPASWCNGIELFPGADGVAVGDERLRAGALGGDVAAVGTGAQRDECGRRRRRAPGSEEREVDGIGDGLQAGLVGMEPVAGAEPGTEARGMRRVVGGRVLIDDAV